MKRKKPDNLPMKNAETKTETTASLRSGGVVVLRWHRIGKNQRKSHCGRWTAYRMHEDKWSLYDRGRSADAATWTQICETARHRMEREAQHNSD